MITFQSDKHSIGTKGKGKPGGSIAENALFECGFQISIRFSDVNQYFNCHGGNYSGQTESVQATASHYRLKPKTVISLVQE